MWVTLDLFLLVLLLSSALPDCYHATHAAPHRAPFAVAATPVPLLGRELLQYLAGNTRSDLCRLLPLDGVLSGGSAVHRETEKTKTKNESAHQEAKWESEGQRL